MRAALEPEDLLAHAGWLRALAIRLARDGDVADDLVQETFIAALHAAPDTSRPVRPWLAKVLRDLVRMRWRGEGRRQAREQVAALAAAEVPTPEALVERAEAQQFLVGEVLALREPFRGTLLLHFHEGMTAAAIARAQGVPAGTVRWRLKVALDELRGRVRERPAWLAALLVLPKGALVAKSTWKPVLLIVLLLLLLSGGGLLLLRRIVKEGPPPVDAVAQTGLAPAARPPPAPTSEAPPPGSWADVPGVAPRRVTGTVVHAGKPVAGATVQLEDWAAAQSVVTDGAGRFEITPRRTWIYVLSASAPEATGAYVELDLRDPRAKVTDLVLELGPCAARVGGRLLDASGAPIASGRVRVLAARTHLRGPFGPLVTTDGDGRYQLCLPRAWSYLRIEADGYGTLFSELDAHGQRRLDFALTPEGVVMGTTIDAATGAPLPGVHLALWPPQRGGRQSPDVAMGESDGAGRFEIHGVAAGRVFVKAQNADHQQLEALQVVVESAQVTGPVTVRLTRGSTVSGVVTEGGRPVAGVPVAMTARRAGVTPGVAVLQSAPAFTDGEGRFVARGVPRDGAIVVAVPPWEVLSPKTLAVTEATVRDVAIEVQARGSLSGHVTDEGRPAPGALVRATREGAPDRDGGARQSTAVADAEGAFEVVGLGPGRYRMLAETGDAFSDEQPVVELAQGERKGGVVVALDSGGVIAGTVVDRRGTPVEGAEVRFVRTVGDDLGSSVTASDGSFEARRLTGGTYRTEVFPFRQAPRPYPGTFPPLELPRGRGRAEGLRLVVDREERTISGVVVDGAGAAVPDALVRAAPMTAGSAPAFWSPEWPSAHTDGEGAFAVAVTDGGAYAVQALRGAEVPSLATDVRGGTQGLVIKLVTPGAIDGTLVGLPGAIVWARRDGGMLATPGQVTGARFHVAGLGAGTYIVSATAPGGGSAAATVAVGEGQTATVRLAAEGTGTLLGQITSFRDGRPVGEMRCVAGSVAGDTLPAALGWNSPAVAIVDRSGAFEIPNAPAGDVVVVCSGDPRVVSQGVARAHVTVAEPARATVMVVPKLLGPAPGSVGLALDPNALTPRVRDVHGGSAADKAGVKRGDVVLAVDGKPVTGLGPDAVSTLIGDRAVGAAVNVTFSSGAVVLEVAPPW